MTIYRGPPADAVQAIPLDELTVVHHRPAGATHLLAEPAPQILAALAEGPADVDALLARLAMRFDLDAAARDGIVAHVEELVAAGLVATA